MAVIKVDLPAFFGMLTDRQMLPESHRKQNETKKLQNDNHFFLTTNSALPLSQ